MHQPRGRPAGPDWLSRSADASSRYWAGASLASDFGSDVQRRAGPVTAPRQPGVPDRCAAPVTGSDCRNHGDHSGDRGLRRALGARRAHIGLHFLAESSLLALTGGTAGAILGAFAATVFAAARHWDAVVPIPALVLAAGSALAVGNAAGIYPALRAARFSPAEGLRTV
jgi:FtsX-like permease family